MKALTARAARASVSGVKTRRMRVGAARAASHQQPGGAHETRLLTSTNALASGSWRRLQNKAFPRIRTPIDALCAVPIFAAAHGVSASAAAMLAGGKCCRRRRWQSRLQSRCTLAAALRAAPVFSRIAGVCGGCAALKLFAQLVNEVTLFLLVTGMQKISLAGGKIIGDKNG